MLSIFTQKGSNHFQKDDFAPLKEIVICPSCPVRNEEADSGEYQEVEEDFHDEDLIQGEQEYD